MAHGITLEETEEVFYNQPLVRKTHSGRYLALGITDAGHYVIVVFEFRSGIVRVVTARPMKESERQLYSKKRGV